MAGLRRPLSQHSGSYGANLGRMEFSERTPGSGVQLRACGLKHLRKRLQLAACRPAETAPLDLLPAVANPTNTSGYDFRKGKCPLRLSLSKTLSGEDSPEL